MHDTDFNLFETFRLEPGDLTRRVGMHIERLDLSAQALGFLCSREQIENKLSREAGKLSSPVRCRLEIDREGNCIVETAPVPASPESRVSVKLVQRNVPGDDLRIRFKTTDRSFYDEPRKAAGTFEVLFLDQEGFLTEGSFTNLFVRIENMFATPPLTRGVLPGILRQELIMRKLAVEQELSPRHLRNDFYVGNSLRGLIPAMLLPSPEQVEID